MAVRAHFALHIKIVEQHKLTRQLVVIGSDPFREKAEGGIAVSLGHIAQHLIVSSVLFDDIDAIFDGARITWPAGNGIALEFGLGRSAFSARQAMISLGGMSFHLLHELVAPRQFNDAQSPLK
jgi:hypothetical protein